MGNEIGNHSYTHLINPPTVDANGNPVPTIVVNGGAPSTWNENTNTLYVTPPANGSAPNWTFAYEFGQSNTILQQNIGITIAGAAVPGANETMGTSQQIMQYYQTVAGRSHRIRHRRLDRGRLRLSQCVRLHEPDRYRLGLHRAEHHVRLHRNPIPEQDARAGARRLGSRCSISSLRIRRRL